MDRLIKNMRIISLSLGLLSAFGLIYNLCLFSYLRPRVINFEALGSQVEILGVFAGVCLIIIAVFHLCAVGTLLLQITTLKQTGLLKILSVVLGIISGLLILSDLAMLQDIGRQYEMGWDTAGEWTILSINHGIHLLLTILAFPALAGKSKESGDSEETALKETVLFTTTHTTGLLCGAIGLIAILLALLIPLPTIVIEAIVMPIGLLILLPYLIILVIWLLMKRKEAFKEWFDEKQFQDVTKASLWSLIITIPCMITIGIVQRANAPGNVYYSVWLPIYIFLCMLTFSATILYLSRK